METISGIITGSALNMMALGNMDLYTNMNYDYWHENPFPLFGVSFNVFFSPWRLCFVKDFTFCVRFSAGFIFAVVCHLDLFVLTLSGIPLPDSLGGVCC